VRHDFARPIRDEILRNEILPGRRVARRSREDAAVTVQSGLARVLARGNARADANEIYDAFGN